MADQPPEPEHGRCVWCAKDVTREDPDALWKTASGAWKCLFHPRAGHSKVTPHKVG